MESVKKNQRDWAKNQKELKEEARHRLSLKNHKLDGYNKADYR